MKSANFKTGCLLAALVSVVLSACGGGGSAEAPDTSTAASSRLVPASALVSASAFSSYAGSLVLTESGEALWVTEMVAPTSETDTPLTL